MGIRDIRREYGARALTKESAGNDPFTLFQSWLKQAVDHETHDPSAMILSTVDKNNKPDSRVLLLKDIQDNQFLFYTNYQSQKALQIDHNPNAALNFYWPTFCRQVRIRGKISKISEKISDNYFASRPLDSQISAIASPQSEAIPNRKTLESAWQETQQSLEKQKPSRPKSWGGYQLKPEEFEFWQGRNSRLHDRIHFLLQHDTWIIERLAP